MTRRIVPTNGRRDVSFPFSQPWNGGRPWPMNDEDRAALLLGLGPVAPPGGCELGKTGGSFPHIYRGRQTNARFVVQVEVPNRLARETIDADFLARTRRRLVVLVLCRFSYSQFQASRASLLSA